jgi:quinol monooxygenase YgiN
MTVAPDGSAPVMLLASIGFRAQPHKRAEVLSAVDETVRRMRQASGCARSRLMSDTDDPNAFTVLSEWQSADTADSFFNSRDFQIFKGIRILLRDEPVIVLDDVRSRVTRLLRAR